jgi:DNA-binding PadR family transcriptional regulator
MPSSLPLHWFHILLALADRPQHGQGITEEVLRHSEGRVQLWPGMLYTALRRMGDEGYVTDAPMPEGFRPGGGKPKFYRVTPLGKRVCATEAARLARIVGTAHDRRVLKGTRSV